MLPARAFETRGSVVGGRGMRLHGGSDYYYVPEEYVPDGYGGWAPPPEPSYDPGPQPSYDPGPQPSYDGGGGGYVVSDPVYYQPEPAPPPAPDWNQTVNDIYIQTFGRAADPSGLATFTNLLNQGWTGEQVRGALTSSQEYQQQQAAQPAAPQPQAPTPQPQAPAAQTPADTVNALYQQHLGRGADASGMATFTNLLNSGWTPAQIANAITSSSEYQQRNPGAQPTPPGVPAQKFSVVEQVTGSGGDSGYNTNYYLADQNGNIVQSLKSMTDDSGNFLGYGITSSSGGGDNSTEIVTPLNLDQLNQRAAQLAAAPPKFGAGEGKATGQPYALVRNDGLPYKEFDGQGNLTRWRDKDWQWHSASEVQATGTEVRADGTIVPTFDLGGRIVMAPIVPKETGGFFAGVDWKMAASIALMAVLAVAGPAVMAAIAGETAAAAGGALALGEGGFIAADAAADAGAEASADRGTGAGTARVAVGAVIPCMAHNGCTPPVVNPVVPRFEGRARHELSLASECVARGMNTYS